MESLKDAWIEIVNDDRAECLFLTKLSMRGEQTIVLKIDEHLEWSIQCRGLEVTNMSGIYIGKVDSL